MLSIPNDTFISRDAKNYITPVHAPITSQTCEEAPRLGYATGKCIGELADMNKAIEYCTEVLLVTPDGRLDKAKLFSDHGSPYGYRFRPIGELVDLNKPLCGCFNLGQVHVLQTP